MANRRKFLAGLGALASGSAAAVGTGAFSSVSAQRSINVGVADDSDALLALDAKTSGDDTNDNADYAEETNNAISINITSSNSNLNQNPSGVNEGTTNIYDIFTVTNQGTQNAFVYVDPSTLPQAVKPDGDNDGETEYGETEGQVYLDPQGTDLPNASSSSTGENGRLSLTGVYGNSGDPTNGFASASAYNPEDLTLTPGDSFDFGLVIKADGKNFPSSISFDIVADADLAADLSS